MTSYTMEDPVQADDLRRSGEEAVDYGVDGEAEPLLGVAGPASARRYAEPAQASVMADACHCSA